MTAAKRDAIRNALKQYREAGEAVCDACANSIAQAHGVTVRDVWREVRCNEWWKPAQKITAARRGLNSTEGQHD